MYPTKFLFLKHIKYFFNIYLYVQLSGMRQLFIPILVFLVTGMAFASNQPQALFTLDSVFVEVDESRNLHVVHTTEPKQTLYSIAKLYGVSLSELYDLNPDLNQRIVREYEHLRIPTPGHVHIDPEAQTGPRIYYTVKAKETLFRIARVYFDLSIDDLKKLNALPNENISIGQHLYLGRMTTEELEADAESGSIDSLSLSEEVELTGQNWTENKKCIAYWLKESSNNGNSVVLHNEAPLNSIILITNPMYGKTIQAKVIGRIPPKVYPGDIDVILSRHVAEELGAIDARFYVKLKHIQH